MITSVPPFHVIEILQFHFHNDDEYPLTEYENDASLKRLG